MHAENITLVIFLVAVIVIGVNGMLYLALRRGNEANMVDLARKSLSRARSPWQDEEENLKELAELVANLKPPDQTGADPAEDRGDPIQTGRANPP